MRPISPAVPLSGCNEARTLMISDCEVLDKLDSTTPIGELYSWHGIPLDCELQRLFAVMRRVLGNAVASKIGEVQVVQHLIAETNTASLIVTAADEKRGKAVARLSDPRWTSFSGVSLEELLSSASRKARSMRHQVLGTEHLLWTLLVVDHPPMMSVLKQCKIIEVNEDRDPKDRTISQRFVAARILARVESFLAHRYYPFGGEEFLTMKREVPEVASKSNEVTTNFLIRHLARRESTT